MAIHAKNFLTDMQLFSKDSMTWCAQESEQAAMNIAAILNSLVADAARRGTMSQTTLAMLNRVQADFRASGDASYKDIRALATALDRIGKGDDEIGKVTAPIVEALQFQDRLRQNLENIAKVITTWIEIRQKANANGSNVDLTEIGNRMLKCMTSVAERDIVRDLIPGLAAEEAAPDDVMLF